jgi:hypothetical protein
MKHFVLLAVALAACSNDPPPPTVENTGSSCTAPAQCYPGLDAGALKGKVECLTKVPGGHCTHQCTVDGDCCAVPGECKSGFKQVCAPLENQPQKYCFLSCEAADITASGAKVDEATYCGTYSHTGFGCRSTGGGTENRKVCLP